jgi:hypothetical protein
LLLDEYPALAPQEPAQSEHQTESQPDIDEDKKEESPGDESSEKEFSFEDRKTSEDDVAQKPQNQEEEPEITDTATPQKDVKPKKADTEPSVKSVDWADVGRKFSQEKKHTPVWIVGLIIVLIIAAFVAYFLYENGFFTLSDATEQEQTQEQMQPENTSSQSSLSLELEDSLTTDETVTEMPVPDENGTQLDEVLQLTVYAAYDGLGPVRVWSDIKPRMDPYWLEQGSAMHFEFSDTIRVRGPYEDMLLFKDGNLIENYAQNFLQQEPNYIELTRDFFESDEKWATSVDYELPEGVPPPDSIANRPTF